MFCSKLLSSVVGVCFLDQARQLFICMRACWLRSWAKNPQPLQQQQSTATESSEVLVWPGTIRHVLLRHTRFSVRSNFQGPGLLQPLTPWTHRRRRRSHLPYPNRPPVGLQIPEASYLVLIELVTTPGKPPILYHPPETTKSV